MKTVLLLMLALAGCARPSANQSNVAADVVTVAPVATPTSAPAPAASTVSAEPVPPAIDQLFNEQQLAVTPAARGVPADVQHFIAAYEECEHWAGEEPFDADRRKEIDAGIAASCTGIDARLARLHDKYAGDAAIFAKLADYAPVHL